MEYQISRRSGPAVQVSGVKPISPGGLYGYFLLITMINVKDKTGSVLAVIIYSFMPVLFPAKGVNFFAGCRNLMLIFVITALIY